MNVSNLKGMLIRYLTRNSQPVTRNMENSIRYDLVARNLILIIIYMSTC